MIIDQKPDYTFGQLSSNPAAKLLLRQQDFKIYSFKLNYKKGVFTTSEVMYTSQINFLSENYKEGIKIQVAFSIK